LNNKFSLFQKFFFFWRYLGHPPWDTGIAAPELVSLISNLNPGRALDIGCGGGTNVCALAEKGWQVRGIDFVPRAVSITKRRLRKKGLLADISVGDATQMDLMDLGGPFQLALDIGCFHSLTGSVRSIQGYVRGLRHWLAGGGLYLLYVHEARLDGKIMPHGVSRELIEKTFTDFLSLKTVTPGREGNWCSVWYLFAKMDS
jgi:SAM-dependent methyltransferase